MAHPSGGELYEFFSQLPGSQLSREERERIAVHVLLCPECKSIGKWIEGDDRTKGLDETIGEILATPKSEEDKAALERSLAWAKRFLETENNKVY